MVYLVLVLLALAIQAVGFLLTWACALAAGLCWIAAAFCFVVWLVTGVEGGPLKTLVFFAYGAVPFSTMMAMMLARDWAAGLPDRVEAARAKRWRLEAAGREMRRGMPGGARASDAEDARFDP